MPDERLIFRKLLSRRRTVDNQHADRCRGVRRSGRSTLVTLLRTGDFRQEDAIAARFMRSNVVRENDGPLHFAKHFLLLPGNCFRARRAVDSQHADRCRGVRGCAARRGSA